MHYPHFTLYWHPSSERAIYKARILRHCHFHWITRLLNRLHQTQVLFTLVILFFRTKISFDSYWWLLFICGDLLLLFQEFVIAHWVIFIMGVSKSLYGNSGICIILVLVSVDWLFSWNLRFFCFLAYWIIWTKSWTSLVF